MNRHLIILFVLFAFIANAGSAQTQSKALTEAAPQAGGFSAARLTRLDSGINDWIKKHLAKLKPKVQSIALPEELNLFAILCRFQFVSKYFLF